MSSSEVESGRNISVETPTSPINDDEKQRQLDQKMEEMRRKNEQLRRRYEEIEADKRNANMNSRIAGNKLEDEEEDEENDEDDEESKRQISPHGKGMATARRSREGEERQPQHVKGRGRIPSSESAVPYQQKPGQQHRLPSSGRGAPPPDPRFSFLDDPLRSGAGRGVGRSQGGFDEYRRGGHRGHAPRGNWAPPGKGRGRGYQPVDPQEPNYPCQGDPDYMHWKQERYRIDAERLARQQTSSGQWKREWDTDKHVLQNEEAPQHGERRDFSLPRGGGRGGGSGHRYNEDRQQRPRDYQRPPDGHPGGPMRQQQRYGGHPFRDDVPNEGNRRVYEGGQSMKVTVPNQHQDQSNRDQALPHVYQHRNTNVHGPPDNAESVSDASGDRKDAPWQSDQQGPWSTPPRQQRRKGQSDNQTNVPFQQGASVDSPSSEYASPEPPAHEDNQGMDQKGTEEDEQWEDVEDDAAGYYADDAGHVEQKEENEEHQDDPALLQKLEEMERRIQLGEPQADMENAGVNDSKQAQDVEPEAAVVPNVECKETSSAVKRRQTTESGGEGGPEIDDGPESRTERSRQESMEQIERDMLARLDENIQAAEAALDHSEEDFDLLLSGSGPLVGAPLIEGADEEELLRDDEDEKVTTEKESCDQKELTKTAGDVENWASKPDTNPKEEADPTAAKEDTDIKSANEPKDTPV